jgi:hypothetical protein
MTTVPNSTCTSVTITSSNFNASNLSNSLAVSINGGTAVTINLPASTTSYTFNAASLSVDTLPVGVYEFTLSSVNSLSVSLTDKKCLPLVCSLVCDENILDYYKDKETFSKALAMEALKITTDCDTCTCSLMQNFYNHIIDDTSTTNCGCE